ncbi:MAG: tetratricopeptide repeat protein [Anaerolineae bacterium]|nr:tetratricopeptide repeat protein [Candidatus Roseilinea sp.]MDW8450105.1 tetratricopeptide repeat protein [Anaerolineae bacterium]
MAGQTETESSAASVRVPRNLPLRVPVPAALDQTVQKTVESLRDPDIPLVNIAGGGEATAGALVAAESAHRLLEAGTFSGGICWLDCAGRDGSLEAMLDTIQRTFGLTPAPTLREAVRRYLREHPCLLVFAGYDAVAQSMDVLAFVTGLPAASKALLVSRTPAGLRGVVVRVADDEAGLASPEVQAMLQMNALLQAFTAVQEPNQMRAFWQAVPAELEKPLIEAIEAFIRQAPSDADPNAMESLRAKLADFKRVCEERSAKPAGGPDIPPHFRAGIQQAQGAEQQYLRTGDLAALDEAAAAWERILGHPDFPATDVGFRLAAMNATGTVLLRRYWARGQIADLERALALWQQVVALAPPDAPDRAGYLNNLATGLRDRYARTGAPDDLEAAIVHWQQAVALTPPDAPDRAGYLNNLAAGLSDRYARTGALPDLEAAIAHWQQVVALTPPDAPDRAALLNNLAGGLRDR